MEIKGILFGASNCLTCTIVSKTFLPIYIYIDLDVGWSVYNTIEITRVRHMCTAMRSHFSRQINMVYNAAFHIYLV